MKHLILSVALTCAVLAAAPAHALKLMPAGTYASGVFDESAAEIVTYDMKGKRIYVVNADSGDVDVLDASDIANPKKVRTFDFSKYGKAVNSVAFHDGMIAVAVEANDKQAPGVIVVTDAMGKVLGSFRAGALPDMVTFTPDGKYILAANEGEPNDAYSVDPEGSVTIIDISSGIGSATNRLVRFTAFNPFKEHLQAQGIRISHPKASVAQDLEPEYIAVAPDSKTAFVALQENNAVAVVDIEAARVTKILALGLKHWWHGLVFDASDKDGKINLHPWPVSSAYMPDSIVAFSKDGRDYFITANEGDSREYGDYSDEIRLGKAKLDPKRFPNAAALQDKAALGRLKTIPDLSDMDGDGDFDRIVGFGGRSFTIWDDMGNKIFDSGDEFEKILAEQYPDWFNTTNDEHKFDNRSDDKGCEPEAVEVGMIDGKLYCFIGLERMGGIMIYDITVPEKASFVSYRLDRDFSGDPKAGKAGDLGPEGVTFVPAEGSHTGEPLLIVGSEVSGTTTIYTFAK